MSESTTDTLDVPGATLTYDVRGADTSAERVLLVIGSPMGASGFGALVAQFPDRTVVTYDPRGVDRSTKADPGSRSTPEEHADDLHRLIAAVDAGPVDMFATSGGAINALALVAANPDDVRTLIAHEPPAAQLLPDRNEALAAIRDIAETYERSGFGAGMAKFIASTSVNGPFPPDYVDQPSPAPELFGLPTEDDGSRNDPLLGQNLVSSTAYEPDFDALARASTRIVIGAGSASKGEMAHRAAEALALRLGTDVVEFPGGHIGFMRGEYGQPGDPEPFAATLREILAGG